MKGDALANMLQDRRILVIIVAVIVIIAAAAAFGMLKDVGYGGSDDPSDGLTIDNERTISEDMVIEGDLVITDKGKLTLADGATISMLGPNAKIDVKGTLDATDGNIEFIVEDEEGNYSSVYNNSDKGTRSITSTGTMTISGENFESTDHFDNYTGIKNFVNSASYDNKPNVVLTSVAKALAAKDDVKIYGTISEAGEISLSEKKSIILVEDANATLGTIKLINGADIDLTSGTLTSTISNSAGSVSLSKASGITVGSVALDRYSQCGCSFGRQHWKFHDGRCRSYARTSGDRNDSEGRSHHHPLRFPDELQHDNQRNRGRWYQAHSNYQRNKHKPWYQRKVHTGNHWISQSVWKHHRIHSRFHSAQYCIPD